jgi:hypothetical protein
MPRQGLAQSIAESNLDTAYTRDTRLRGALRRIFSSLRQTFLKPTLFDDKSLTDLGIASHLFLRHQLLDQLLDSLGYPSNEFRVNFAKIPMDQPITKNLQTVRRILLLLADTQSRFLCAVAGRYRRLVCADQ